MSLTFKDFLSIFEIALVLFASGFALLLPLYAYLKNLNLSLKVCIPLSISLEVLIGYVFYTFGQAKNFPLIYLLFILLINIVLAFKLNLIEKIKKTRFKFNWQAAVPVFLVIASIVYSRFYDAILNVAPGAIDTRAHAQYILDIDLYGRLTCTYYAPGFHILIYPLSKIVEMVNIYRFTGPVLGIITMLSLYLLFKDFFKNKLSLYLLILAFPLPVFSILTLQTISFFPTILTFIFLPLLIYALIRPKELPTQKHLLFFAVTVSALALTVPYLLVQLIPAIILLNIIALAAIKILSREYLAYLSKISVISIFGFLLAFGHVYLQNTVTKETELNNFPQITIAEAQDSGFVISSNLDKASRLLENQEGFLKIISKNTVVGKYFIPMMMTGEDTVSVKNVRPLDSIMSAAAYLWIIVSLIMIYLGIRRKDHILLVFGSLILVFGLATQTGVFEMSMYRGRSGWYLLLFALFASIYFLDKVVKKIPRIISFTLLAVLLIVPFVKPPTFYRGYFTEYFTQALLISRQFPNQKILLISGDGRAVVVSKNFVYDEFKPSSITETCDFDQCFLIFANKFFEVDPIKSQSTLAIDKDQKDFRAQWAVLAETYKENIEAIKNSPNFSKYRLYWANENLSVYKFEK